MGDPAASRPDRRSAAWQRVHLDDQGHLSAKRNRGEGVIRHRAEHQFGEIPDVRIVHHCSAVVPGDDDRPQPGPATDRGSARSPRAALGTQRIRSDAHSLVQTAVNGAPLAEQPAPTSDDIVRVVDVRKSYGPLLVLAGVSLEVGRGEVVVLIGRSGSGKTTLVRCINCLETIDSGRIYVEGELVGYKVR